MVELRYKRLGGLLPAVKAKICDALSKSGNTEHGSNIIARYSENAVVNRITPPAIQKSSGPMSHWTMGTVSKCSVNPIDRQPAEWLHVRPTYTAATSTSVVYAADQYPVCRSRSALRLLLDNPEGCA